MAALWKNVGKISIATAFSRVFGLFREQSMAILLGTGYLADCFTAAFRIPNMFRQLLAEGALSAAFIPTYSELLGREDRERAMGFGATMFWMQFMILLVVVGLAILTMPWLIHLFVWGWRDEPAKLDLTMRLARWLFPYLLFVAPAALFMAMLNAHRSFFVPALAPIMLNVCWIGAAVTGIVLVNQGWSPERVLPILIAGVLAGGIGQWVFQWFWLYRQGFRLKPDFKRDLPVIGKVLALMIPGILALAVVEINLLSDMFLASYLGQGALPALNYANRLVLLPMGVFGVAIAQASLPELSRLVVAGEKENYNRELGRALSYNIWLLLPLAALIIALAKPLIVLLLQYGAFSATESTPLTVGVLQMSAIGLLSYGAVKAAAQGHFAHSDTRTPMIAAVTAMLANIGLAILFIGPLEVKGLALASACSSTLNLALLLWWLRPRAPAFDWRGLGRSFGLSLTSALLTALAAWGLSIILESALPGLAIWQRAVRLAVPGIGGMAVYMISAGLLGNPLIRQLYSRFRTRLSGR